MNLGIKKTDLDDAFHRLAHYKSVGFSFIIFIFFSTIICLLAFLLDSTIILIGGMVISPLLYPIMGLVAALIRKEYGEALKIFLFLIGGVFIIISLSVIVSLIRPFDLTSTIIVERLAGEYILLFFVAFISGMAGATAFYWPRVAEAITGIAIAIALMPPMVIFGCSLILEPSLIIPSGIVSILNFIGVMLGTFIVLITLRMVAK